MNFSYVRRNKVKVAKDHGKKVFKLASCLFKRNHPLSVYVRTLLSIFLLVLSRYSFNYANAENENYRMTKDGCVPLAPKWWAFNPHREFSND